MPRITSRRRKLLEEPEEVLNLAQRLLEHLKGYWKWLLVGGIVVAVALGAWGINSKLQAGKEEKAGAALAQLRAKLPAGEANAEALKGLEELIRDYPGTPAAREAEILRAHLLYQTQQYAEAAKAYESLQKGRDPGWDTLVAESLSYCYEALGDFKKAAAVLKPATEKTFGGFQSDLWRRLAWLYEKAGEPQEAVPYWRKLLDQPPQHSLVPYLKEKVAAAEALPKK
jgi:predicted negative regulator of RcsB-dependent stress response